MWSLHSSLPSATRLETQRCAGRRSPRPRSPVCVAPEAVTASALAPSPFSVCCLVAKSCLTLRDPTDCRTPDFPVPHRLPEFARVHTHCIGRALYLILYCPLLLHLPSSLLGFMFIEVDHIQHLKIPVVDKICYEIQRCSSPCQLSVPPRINHFHLIMWSELRDSQEHSC